MRGSEPDGATAEVARARRFAALAAAIATTPDSVLQEVAEEFQAWDVTLQDGLEDW